MTTVYLEFEGAPVPATDLAWYHVAPCGCTSGVMTIDAGENGAISTTEDQAWDNWMGSKAVRDNDRKQGHRLELGRLSDSMARLTGPSCPHTPRWGVEKTPTPDGHTWVHAGGRARRIHLVPGEPTQHRITVINWRDEDPITALCGEEHYSWDAWPGLRSDYLECGKCAAAAKAGQVQL